MKVEIERTFNEITVKLVYKGYWRDLENVSFMSSWPLYTGSNCMHYSLHGENETALYRQWFYLYTGALYFFLNLSLTV
jgi:hypothetical protein